MKLKPLTFKSIEELERNVDRKELIKVQRDSKDDGRCLIELFNQNYNQLSKQDKGDQETIYQIFYKLLMIKDLLLKSNVYKDDKLYVTLMIKQDHLDEINDKLSKLRSSLQSRYKNEEKIEINFNRINFNESSTSAKQDLTCKQLFELFRELSATKSKLLLIDLRSKEDFEKSSISITKEDFQNYLITLNIPEERIKKGITCSTIESLLNTEELAIFKERNQMHTVLLMDYESTSLTSNDQLFTFYQALAKFDTTPNRLKKEPLFLKGGFAEWLMTYPMYCTDSSAQFSTNKKRSELDYQKLNKYNNFHNDTLNAGDHAVERIYSKDSTSSLSVPGSAKFIGSINKPDQSLNMFKNTSSSFNNNLSNNFSNSLNSNKYLNDDETDNLNNFNNKPKTIYHPIHIERDNDSSSNYYNNDTNSLSTFSKPDAFFSKPISAFKNESTNDFSNSFSEAPSIFSSSLNNRKSKSYINLTDLNPKNEDDDYEANQLNSALSFRKPSFDRTNKPSTNSTRPSASMSREFSPVYTTTYDCTTGLKNLGNTCFMNAVIQCLFNVKIFSSYFITEEYLRHLNDRSKFGTKGELTEEFGLLLKQMDQPQVKHISPKDFRRVVGNHIAAYRGCEQQDSHEFLLILFEKLNADLNKVQSSTPNVEIPDTISDKEAVERFWTNHLANNNSIISKLFEGLIMSTLECDTCHKKSNTFEVFTCLSLPLKSDVSRLDLTDCLREFTKNELMCDEAAWSCPQCKVKRPATKTTSIVRLPKVLIIHLKRFSYEGMWKQKISVFVDFPKNLNLRHFISYISMEQSSVPSYDLIGVVDHTGSLEGGHYTAICRSNNLKWNKYDDQDVSEISPQEVVSHKAYLLFYVLNN